MCPVKIPLVFKMHAHFHMEMQKDKCYVEHARQTCGDIAPVLHSQTCPTQCCVILAQKKTAP